MEGVEFCFTQSNTSCKKMTPSHLVATLIYCLLASVTLFTVVLNLLVIISISHFRQSKPFLCMAYNMSMFWFHLFNILQLQTTTNLLLLSLAVADFIIGFVQMPAMILIFRGCWTLGDTLCAMVYFLGYISVSVSVGNTVLISVDRYIAICEPMFYSTRVTVKRVQLCVCLCWMFSAVHSTWIMRNFLKQPDKYKLCQGDCVEMHHYAEEIVDLIVTFLGPVLIIIVLYVRVFVVAVSQAHAMHSQMRTVAHQHSEPVKAKKSVLKASRALGVVVVVFLLCSSPYYCFTLANLNNLMDVLASGVEVLLMYFNSCLNPLIYAFSTPGSENPSNILLLFGYCSLAPVRPV